MAIRCMELGIPAAIGVGEKHNFYSSKNEVEKLIVAEKTPLKFLIKYEKDINHPRYI